MDVAQVAGVSVATVSRALRGLPNVSPATRQRVLSAADELEYTASPLAAALVTGRTRSVGVIVSPDDRRFFTEVLRGVEVGLREREYDLVLHLLPEAGQRDRFFAGPPMRRRVDGLLLAGLRLTEAEVTSLRQLQLPIAAIGEPLEGAHTERVDEAAAARFAVQHLIDLGHTQIAMIGGPPPAEGETGSAVTDRAQGFRAGLAAAGLRPVAMLAAGLTPSDGGAAMTELLAADLLPTAVVCQSDELAFGALQTIWWAGLRCPESIAVIGFGDHELAGAFQLTTIAEPISEQGAAAARWLTAGLDRRRPGTDADPPVTGDEVLHPVRLVLRGSTAAVPRADLTLGAIGSVR